MGNRHGADKNKKKNDKKKDKDSKKAKKKTKNRLSSTPSEQDSQALFESLEDVSQGACAAPRTNIDTKSRTQPDVLADITFDPATRPRDHSTHGAWSSDDDSPTTTLGYSTPLLQTPKTQRSAHGTLEPTPSAEEHLQELDKSVENIISQNVASSQGEVRLRNKSESLSPASSPGLSRDVRKKRALGQAIHENGSSKAIAAAILFAPTASQKEKGEQSPGTKPNPEISIVGEDRDSLEDALCPWLKDDDISIDEEQLDEMFISCIDLSYSMADACSEKEFTGGSEADFSSLESKSRIKDHKKKQKQTTAGTSGHREWEGSSVDPVSSALHNVRTPIPNQPKSSPLVKIRQTPKVEKYKSDKKEQSKTKVIGSSVDRENAESDSTVVPVATKDTERSKTKTSNKQPSLKEDSSTKGNGANVELAVNKTKKQGPKPAKKPGKSKDRKRKNSKSKIIPVSEPLCVGANSDVTIKDGHKHEGNVDTSDSVAEVCNTGLEKIPNTPDSRNLISQLEENLSEKESPDKVILKKASPECLGSTFDEPHRFMGDGQTPADFAASIMLSMSDPSRDFTTRTESSSRDRQPMSKLVERITGFIREETIISEDSETMLHKKPELSRDTSRGLRTDVRSDTYSQVLDKVFLKTDKQNVDASFSEGYSSTVSGSGCLRDRNDCVEMYGENNQIEYTPDICDNTDLCMASPHLYPEEVEMYVRKSEHRVTEEKNKPSFKQALPHAQPRSMTSSDDNEVCDNIAGQVTRQSNKPTVRASTERADDKHADDQWSHALAKSIKPHKDGNQDVMHNTLSELEQQISEASITESFKSAPLVTKTNISSAVYTNHADRSKDQFNSVPSDRTGGQPEAGQAGQPLVSSHVPPPSPSAMDALAELDEDQEEEQTDLCNEQKSKEIQMFGDSVLKRLSSLIESQGNESSDGDHTSLETGQFDKLGSTTSEQDSVCGVYSVVNKDECVFDSMVGLEQVPRVPVSSKCDTETDISGHSLQSELKEFVKVPQQIPLTEYEQYVKVSKDKPIIQSNTNIKDSERKPPQLKKTSETSFETNQSVSSITDSQKRDYRLSSGELDTHQPSEMNQRAECETIDSIKQTDLPVGANDNKCGNTKRKSKSKKAKAKAKKQQAKLKKSKSRQADSTENVSPKLIVKRPKIPDELTYVLESDNPKPDSNTRPPNPHSSAVASNPHSNTVQPNPDSNTLQSNPDSNTVQYNPVSHTVLPNPDSNSVASNPDSNNVLSNPDSNTVLSNPDSNTILSNPDSNNVLSNTDSNTVPPKRESQQITEVIDAYVDVADKTTAGNGQMKDSSLEYVVDNSLTKEIHKDGVAGDSSGTLQTCLESVNKLTQDINNEEQTLTTELTGRSVERESESRSVNAATEMVECQDEKDKSSENNLPDLLASNNAKRPEGLPLQRIIQNCGSAFREPKASWELSDESDTTEESFEKMDLPAAQSPHCESSSSADSVFRIPDISETFGEMDSVKNILDDFEDKTPQAECLPLLVGKELLLRAQPEFLNVHRRSRMSPALTNRTESDLDISEMRDDISTDSMYADDEGDGTLLFSKSYTEQTPGHGSGVLMSYTFYNSSHNKEDSDDFWEDCADEAYHQIEISADAASTTFEDARKQMHEIHEHLRTLRLQMETLQDDLENASITPEAEFQTESDDKRLITE